MSCFHDESDVYIWANNGFESMISSGHKDAARNVTMTLELISAIIYRTRCCIAHNRLGEYIIGVNDIDFVKIIAVPLLIGVIKKIF
jgi:hypothetical protein